MLMRVVRTWYVGMPAYKLVVVSPGEYDLVSMDTVHSTKMLDCGLLACHLTG